MIKQIEKSIDPSGTLAPKISCTVGKRWSVHCQVNVDGEGILEVMLADDMQ